MSWNEPHPGTQSEAHPGAHPDDHQRHLLNTDGRRHPRENAMSVATLVLGIIAMVCTVSYSLASIGAIAGLIGVVLGAYTQLVSATTGERWFIVIGTVASALGLGLNAAHGALFL